MEKIKDFFKKYPWVQHVILMIGISIVLIFFISLFIKCYARHGKEFKMPQYALTKDSPGMTVEEAMKNNNLFLEFVVDTVPYNPNDSITKNPNFRPGVILDQNPKAGSMIKTGRKVYVRIAAAKAADVIMPELTGLSVRQAVSEIYSCGLEVGNLTFVDDPFKNNVKEQLVHGRAIYAGQKVAPGTAIDLIVGNGDNGDGVEVPFVIAKTAEEAHRDIYNRSLNVGREHWEGVKDRTTARVYRQYPNYTGVNKYPFGTSIELWYKDATEAEAQKMIDEFKVDSSEIFRPDASEIPDIDDIIDDDIW